jgi:pimeloyl-ACP methyl ester carboxylesterase
MKYSPFSYSPLAIASLAARAVVALAVLILLTSSNSAWAQAVEPVAAKAAEPEDPKEETVTLTTNDGVQLKCTYFRGEDGKNSVPLILVHGEGGNRGQFDSLARYLQTNRKCAIIVPDLRKHGGSKRWKNPRKEEMEDLPTRLTKFDVAAMTLSDLKACKKFLLKKNNEGKLNIDKLGVLGAEEGCIVAANFMAKDWNAQQFAGYRQGRDVKALMFLSPASNFRGVSMQIALKQPVVAQVLSVYVTAGSKTSKVASAAARLTKQIDLLQARAPDKGQAVYAKLPTTSLQGTAMLNGRLKTELLISAFIKKHLVELTDHDWAERKRPS